jgi:hypothetical protein
MQARQHATDGNRVAAAYSMKQATELFVAECAESIGLKIPFKRSPVIWRTLPRRVPCRRDGRQ